MRLTETRNASSAARPTATRLSICSRRWSSNSARSTAWNACRVRRKARHWLICVSSIGSPIVQAPRGTGAGTKPLPQAAQRAIHRFPLPAVFGELRPPLARDAVIFAAAAGIGAFPACLDMAKPLQPVQHGIEHAVGPLHAPARQRPDPLQDGVAIAVALHQDGQHDRGGGCRDQILAEFHDPALRGIT